ncbi:hypothetical protein [Bathymodiolus thermophilus thioautotrophic gill symbiont]|uniref:Uncharacterized protein n=1 Tax=Bathymodiolus thermophilus thioautotrophic gill symbiont TaxID=2360 RepID=A0A1J5UHW0_9GAMM|nr:hypothetical protein [Bathymodiolus thermophilus thioautotrophic gill symbiont]OIR23855.1 hypothetical protein BGC33_14125 [Bathymodiolus thermophilus thioautotrophic gill symbiont]
MSNNDNDIRQKMFDKHSEVSLEREFYNAQAYDKAVLTLATAALGFSFSFFKFFDNPQGVGFIVTSWFLLFLAIVFILFSFWMGNKAIAENIENARKYYLEEQEKAFDKTSVYEKWNTYLNNTSGILFAIGILLFGIFSVCNI